ncbi:MAG TPA: outer membrane beta-barrel protein [Verrucomicrobiales bacterium]|nr:outer membrane beta-barrel protein [Verrucomicrobiales bacterium]
MRRPFLPDPVVIRPFHRRSAAAGAARRPSRLRPARVATPAAASSPRTAPMRRFPIGIATRLSLVMALLAAPSLTPAFIEFEEETGVILLHNELRPYYDSNINANSEEEDDFIFQSRPTLQFLRKSGLLHLDLEAGAELAWFADFSEFDYQNFVSDARLEFPKQNERNYWYHIAGGYNQSSNPDRFLGERIDSDATTVEGAFRYNFSDRFGAQASVGFLDSAYDGGSRQNRGSLADDTEIRGRLDAVYIYSDKLDILAGYQYSDTDSDYDFEDHTFVIGLNGEITPKIQGKLETGWQFRRAAPVTGGNQDKPFASIALSWLPNDRWNVTADVASAYGITSTGGSEDGFRGGLTVAWLINDKLIATLGGGYEDITYDTPGFTRDDEAIFLNGGVEYIFSERAQLRADFRYEDWDSDDEFRTYERWIAGLTFRFSL